MQFGTPIGSKSVYQPPTYNSEYILFSVKDNGQGPTSIIHEFERFSSGQRTFERKEHWARTSYQTD